MLILLTNDDGIQADGLYHLYLACRGLGEVTIVAPDAEQSAVGHAITLSLPLRVKEAERQGRFYGYAVNGTPADCVKIAVRAILKKMPDLVISGINLGPNLGTDVIYSGTVSAATEAAILGIKSIAVSLAAYEKPDFRPAAEFAKELAVWVMKRRLPKDVLLNVNVPPLPKDKIKGVLWTRQGKCRVTEVFHKRKDPRGRTYYWMSGHVSQNREGKEADYSAVQKGYISVTPVHFDLTNYASLRRLRRASIKWPVKDKDTICEK